MTLSDEYLQPPDLFDPDPIDACPDCGSEVGDEIYCQRCGAVLDADEADRDDADNRLYDLHRDMERELQ